MASQLVAPYGRHCTTPKGAGHPGLCARFHNYGDVSKRSPLRAEGQGEGRAHVLSGRSGSPARMAPCAVDTVARFAYSLTACRRSSCGRNSAVECQLPKLDVAGSTPVARFLSNTRISQGLRWSLRHPLRRPCGDRQREVRRFRQRRLLVALPPTRCGVMPGGSFSFLQGPVVWTMSGSVCYARC